MQLGIECGYIVIPLRLVEVACHRDTQVVLRHDILGLSVIAAFACQPFLWLCWSDPPSWLLVDCAEIQQELYSALTIVCIHL